MRDVWFLGRIFSKVAVVVLLGVSGVQAATESSLIGVTNYGWMDQYSLGAGNQGPEDCAPTSSTNAMTFLQNYYSGYFGAGGLTGTTYADWSNTDLLLRTAPYMNSNEGTAEAAFIYGINKYITQTKGFSNVQFSGMYFSTEWEHSSYTEPSFITEGPPTASFIYQSISLGSAFIANLGYADGGGHVVAVNGITWDTDSDTGTLYFVDPLDPTYYDADGNPVGPTAKQTQGTLSLVDGELQLVYDQYHGQLPYDDDYHTATAVLRGGLAIAVPEPGVWGLFVCGVVGVFVARRRRDSNLQS